MTTTEGCPYSVLTYDPGANGALPEVYSFEPSSNGETHATLPVTGAEVIVIRDHTLAMAALKDDSKFSYAAVDFSQYGLFGSSHREDIHDGAAALRLRRPMARELSVRGLEPRQAVFENIAHTSALDFLARPKPEDIITGYCDPFITSVASNVLGIPEDEWPHVKRITRSALRLRETRDDAQAISDSWAEVYEYGRNLAADKRKSPDHSLFSDIIANLDEAELTEEEVSHKIGELSTGLSSAGLGLIVGVSELLQRPEVVEACIKDPDQWPKVVDELLRIKAHFSLANPRIATENVTLDDGRVIPKDTVLVISLAAAAHDPAQVENPDTFDSDQRAQRLTVFGAGAHFCPGANLTRKWLQAGLGQLFTAKPDLQLAVPRDGLVWQKGLMPIPQTMPVR